MGFLRTEYIETRSKLPKIFIETGTFKGGQFQIFLESNTHTKFKKLHTVELSDEFCKIASHRLSLYEKYNRDITKFNRNTDKKDESFKKCKSYFDGHFTIHQGDSATVLGKILENINEPCVIWLDAHPGKEQYVGDNVPLFKELDAIASHPIKSHSIFIDDVENFGTLETYCDWTGVQLEKVMEKLRNINPNYDIAIESPYGMPLIYATLEMAIPYNQHSAFLF